MSYNGTSSISAFSIYRKKFGNKKNSAQKLLSPKLKAKEKLKITVGNNKLKAKKTKKKQHYTATDTTTKCKISDDEEPPTLIPIQKHISHENGDVLKNKCSDIGQLFTQLNKTNPSSNGLKMFKWFIAPINPKIFFEKYWESQVLHIGRNKLNYYSDILNSKRLDCIFREYPLYYSRNVDVVSYENGIKEVHNEEGKVVASALYDYYINGCSIRVLNPQTYDKKVHLLIATLQEYFGNMVGTNVYLTPPGSQGFAPHYDDIEAFVIQLEGRKHWKLYKPVGKDVLARDSSPNLKHEDIGEPFMEVTLNAGDLLYFPRGTIHEGRTDDKSHSLHITVSVYQHNSYADLLEHILPQALKKAAQENIEFRKGLPLNFLKHLGYVNKGNCSIVRQTVDEQVKKLIANLTHYVNVDDGVDKLGRKFMYDSMPPILSKHEAQNSSKCDGDYMENGKICNRVEIEMDTEIRLSRYHCIRAVEEENSSKLYYNTDNAKFYHGEEEQFLLIDANLLPCITKLHNSYPKFIKVEDLPGDNYLSNAQLVSDLWERGLLVTNEPLNPLTDEEDEEMIDPSL